VCTSTYLHCVPCAAVACVCVGGAAPPRARRHIFEAHPHVTPHMRSTAHDASHIQRSCCASRLHGPHLVIHVSNLT
jgi:hypothetical protein